VEDAESRESEAGQGFSVSRGKTKWSTIDANGNELASQAYNYTWDAKNELVGITSINPTPPTVPDTFTFTYDGKGHRVGIVESHGSTVLTSKTFVWCGAQLCQERDSTGHTVTKQFFAWGEQISGTNYYFTRDHLGSVLEMTDSSGNIQASYGYDPWGRQTVLSQAVTADFGYDGYYVDHSTGLDLTKYRAYDPEMGRWLSRDPLFNGRLGVYILSTGRGDSNFYRYVVNNPVRFSDPLGLINPDDPTGAAEQAAADQTIGDADANGLASDLSGQPPPGGTVQVPPNPLPNPGIPGPGAGAGTRFAFLAAKCAQLCDPVARYWCYLLAALGSLPYMFGG
jgi:RHS repeat-associated protein